jgi:hypothetical protein
MLAATRMGERTVLIGDLPVPEPPLTLVVGWRDWVGSAGMVILVRLAATLAWCRRRVRAHPLPSAAAPPASWLADMALLPPAARVASRKPIRQSRQAGRDDARRPLAAGGQAPYGPRKRAVGDVRRGLQR